MSNFLTSDGITIEYYVFGEKTNHPPVLLHHGFGVNAMINWELPGIVPALVAAGHHVISLDARGHGASGKPHDSSFYGEARMAKDVSELLTHLALDKVYLVGYSMGSVVSLITASNDARVTKLAFGGVGSGIVEAGGVDQREVTGTAIAEALLADDPATVTGSAAPFREMADMFGSDRKALAAHAMVVHDSGMNLAAITAPTLVIAGQDDPLAARPEILVAEIPQASLMMVPGDHRSAVMAPEFAAAIIAFL